VGVASSKLASPTIFAKAESNQQVKLFSEFTFKS
jgi:hypothetical protein